MLKGRAISDFLKGRAISDFVVGALIMSYLYSGQIDKPPYPVDSLISYVLATLAIYLGLAKLISHFFSHKNKEEKKNKERKFLLDDEEVDKDFKERRFDCVLIRRIKCCTQLVTHIKQVFVKVSILMPCLPPLWIF